MILQIHPALVRAVGSDDERQALYEELTYELGKKRGAGGRDIEFKTVNITYGDLFTPAKLPAVKAPVEPIRAWIEADRVVADGVEIK